MINKQVIHRYVGFKTFVEMQDHIKSEWLNKPQPKILNHGYSKEYKHFFEV